MKPVIIDNFIDQDSLDTLKSVMLSGGFSWGFSDAVDFPELGFASITGHLLLKSGILRFLFCDHDSVII